MLRLNYKKLCDEINDIKKQFPFTQVSCEGKSVCGKVIFCLTFGTGSKHIFINGAHHGLEWITSALALRFFRDCCQAYVSGCRLDGYDMREMHGKITLYVMPMVNPDGVDMVLNDGMDWQANARGVDINHNYDALWDKARQMEIDAGITGPCRSRYGGAHPESEPETRAVTNFVRENNIHRLIALHTQGEEIFYTFQGLEPAESVRIAMQMASKSGYALSHPESIASCGGCKDWFIREMRRPGFTIEAGKGRNPLPPEQFEQIYEKLKKILLVGITP